MFPDVLEHLYNPEKVLNNIKKYLKDEGSILASIPNVMHYSIVKDLLQGNWSYQEAGILDRTHIRFFTKNEIIRMFERLEYSDLSVSYTSVEINNEDEQFIDTISYLKDSVSKDEFKAYQYLIKAKKQKIITKK